MVRPPRSLPVTLPVPANDNDPPPGVQIIADWPLRIAVTTAELYLLETYLANVVAEMAANDNEVP